jgi:tight adherence protein B
MVTRVLVWLMVAGMAALGALALLRWYATRARWRRLLARASPARVRRGPAWRRVPRVGAAVFTGAVAAGVAAGPVAAGVAVAYGAVAAVIVRWWRRQRAESASRRTAADAVAGLAAELRAGQPVSAALAAVATALTPPAAIGPAALRVGRQVGTAVEVAEASGAPLADVLDRLDTHLRVVDRTRAAAEAQAAGARMSALLLAALPVAGIGLGFAVGIDPFAVLLHTPLGVACLAGAVLLQVGGLAWAARLTRLEVST